MAGISVIDAITATDQPRSASAYLFHVCSLREKLQFHFARVEEFSRFFVEPDVRSDNFFAASSGNEPSLTAEFINGIVGDQSKLVCALLIESIDKCVGYSSVVKTADHYRIALFDTFDGFFG